MRRPVQAAALFGREAVAACRVALPTKPLGLVGGAELVATCASLPRFGAVFFAVAAGGCGLLIWSLLSRFGLLRFARARASSTRARGDR